MSSATKLEMKLISDLCRVAKTPLVSKHPLHAVVYGFWYVIKITSPSKKASLSR